MLLHPEISSGAIDLVTAVGRAAAAASRTAGVTGPRRGVMQRLRMKLRGWDPLISHLAAQAAVRAEMLGESRPVTPCVLLRMDEFPHAAAVDRPDLRTGAYAEFHAILAEAGARYLVAAVPEPCADYRDPAGTLRRGLTPDEVEMLRRLHAEGTAIGLHGRTHRTRSANPRRHSELLGLGAAELAALLDFGDGVLAEVTGARPRVFVPPFNRFSGRQLRSLLGRYDVVSGGPESIALVGTAAGPSWVGNGVYLPSYPPLYGSAATVAEALERLEDAGAGVWLPAVLHWGHEHPDGFAALRRAAPVIARNTVAWDELLGAVDVARAAAPQTGVLA